MIQIKTEKNNFCKSWLVFRTQEKDVTCKLYQKNVIESLKRGNAMNDDDTDFARLSLYTL